MKHGAEGPNDPVRRARAGGVPEWVSLVVLAVLLGGAYLFVPGVQAAVNEGVAVVRSGEQARIDAWVKGFGPWGPLTLLALQLIQVVLAVIPALPIMVASVMGYGPVWGTLLAWGGLLLASSFGYWIGRTFGRVAVDRFVNPKVEARVRDFVDRYGLWAVVVTRLSPLFPADGVSFVAGLTRFGFWRYLAGSAIGTVPVALLLAFLGADVKRLVWGLVVVSLVTLGVFAAYVVRDRRRAARARIGGTAPDTEPENLDTQRGGRDE